MKVVSKEGVTNCHIAAKKTGSYSSTTMWDNRLIY